MSNLAALRAVKKVRLDQLTRSQRHQIQQKSQPWIPRPVASTLTAPSNTHFVLPNPFVAQKMTNGRWRAPVYSLRKQAELVKAAKANGLLHLLPPGPKNPLPHPLGKDAQAALAAKEAGERATTKGLRQKLKEEGQKNLEWLRPITWRGKVKSRASRPGVTLYAGRKRMFKGHKWERMQKERQRKRAILMRDMKKRVYNFKMFHKRGKPNPLKPPRSAKAPKLPF